MSGHNFILKITKGHDFSKNVNGVLVLVLCISSDPACTKFHKNIFDSLKLYSKYDFHTKDYNGI